MKPAIETGATDPLARALAAEAGLRALARRLVSDPHDADDVAQHAFLRWLQKGRGGSPAAFLRRVAERRAIDLHRRQARRARAERAAPPRPPSSSAAELLAAEELRRGLAAAVAALPEPSRTVVWLRFYEDLAPRQIAARLRVPVETVRTRLKRALTALRTRLDAEHGSRERWLGLVCASFGLRAPALTAPATAVAGVAAVLALVAALALGGSEPAARDRDVIAAVPARPTTTPQAAAAVADSSAGTGPRAGATRAAPATDATTPGPRPRTPVAAAVPPSTTHVRFGSVIHADGQPAANLPVWLWDTERPRQAWLPSLDSSLGTPAPELGPAMQRTDPRGRFALPDDRPLLGVTVGIDADTWWSVGRDGGDPMSIRLPRLAELRLQVVHAPARTRFVARLFPGRNADPSTPASVEYASTDVRVRATAGGEATLFLRRRSVAANAGDEVAFTLPADETFVVDIDGLGFAVDDDERLVRAPGRETFRCARTEPIAEIAVVEPDGAPCSVPGRAIRRSTDPARPGDDPAAWYEVPLDAGLATLPLGDRDGLREREVIVLLDDGELFVTRAPRHARSRLRFVRGTGGAGETFELPADLAAATLVAVAVEHAGTGWFALQRPAQQLLGPGEPIASFGVAPGCLTIRGLPPGWERVVACCNDGRLLQIDRGHRTARDVPGRPLRPLELAAERAAQGSPAFGAFDLELTFPTPAGRPARVVRLRRVRFDPVTPALPDWPLFQTPLADLRLRMRAGTEWRELPLQRAR
ncbi:MAG: RNA polymerase sigma factor [Planctomycetes bacterium]|nr:RNA polymerase sigma factor [Planctomycetota bacterium]